MKPSSARGAITAALRRAVTFRAPGVHAHRCCCRHCGRPFCCVSSEEAVAGAIDRCLLACTREKTPAGAAPLALRRLRCAAAPLHRCAAASNAAGSSSHAPRAAKLIRVLLYHFSCCIAHDGPSRRKKGLRSSKRKVCPQKTAPHLLSLVHSGPTGSCCAVPFQIGMRRGRSCCRALRLKCTTQLNGRALMAAGQAEEASSFSRGSRKAEQSTTHTSCFWCVAHALEMRGG